VRREDTTSTHLRKPSIAHVVWNGFILGELLSLQMRIMGICEGAREASALDLGSLHERQTDPRLLDERIHRTNATAVTARHAVDLVEDEARLVRDGHAGCRRRLRRRARRVVSSGLESSAVKRTHAGTLHPAVDALVVDVGASLRGHGAKGRSAIRPVPRNLARGAMHLDELLAPGVARVELERLVPALLGDEVGRRRLADAGWAREQDGPVRADRVLARPLEASLAVGVPGVA
jgi:hypothetical protein